MERQEKMTADEVFQQELFADCARHVSDTTGEADGVQVLDAIWTICDNMTSRSKIRKEVYTAPGAVLSLRDLL